MKLTKNIPSVFKFDGLEPYTTYNLQFLNMQYVIKPKLWVILNLPSEHEKEITVILNLAFYIVTILKKN
jgi:hypothetical protein